ncbi:hypothetical protein VTK26DRAFT_2568 [Humicola hyalothermophila]
MHALQNYGAEEPAFDGNAYTYSSTYHSGTGTLQLYAHHPTPPTAPGGRPEYHMTQLGSYAMTHSRERFIEGASAFRNARDWAKRHRDSFILAANAKARQYSVEAPPAPETTVAAAEQYEDSTADEVFATQAGGTEVYAAAEESALPHYPEDEEPSQDSTSLGAEPAMSFATSFTSSFAAQSRTSSKRNRDSLPLNSRPRKKHDSATKRTRQSILPRAAGSSAQGATSSGSTVPLPASAEEYWSWSEEYQMWYHMNEDGSCLWDEGE